MTKPIDLDRILKLAERTPIKGPWDCTHIFSGEEVLSGLDKGIPRVIGKCGDQPTAIFIAVCDPTTITAMAQELKEAREVIDFYSNGFVNYECMGHREEVLLTQKLIFDGGKKAKQHQERWGNK